jgi:hypothetical protein
LKHISQKIGWLPIICSISPMNKAVRSRWAAQPVACNSEIAPALVIRDLLHCYVVTDPARPPSQKYLEFNRPSRPNPPYSDARLRPIQTRVRLPTQASTVVEKNVVEDEEAKWWKYFPHRPKNQDTALRPFGRGRHVIEP